jgi:RND family efflux transporter MFP subunit
MTNTNDFRRRTTGALLLLTVSALSACGKDGAADAVAHGASADSTRTAGRAVVLTDTTIATTFEAAGVAEPMQHATLSTKLMSTVEAVLVHEGDVVAAGQALLQLDARDLSAKAAQIAASIADAEAMLRETTTQAARMRALFADSAATRAQFDAAETAVARADAGLRAARASAKELDAMSSYATIRAPFSGVIVTRTADPGSLASPGMPLLTIDDVATLRIRATVSADAARTMRRGLRVAATIDGVATSARIEAIVPATSGNLFTVNAIVENPRGTHRAGSAATLSIVTGSTRALAVPLAAIIREGDLTGVIVRGPQRDERRWIRIGAATAGYVEVLSGLRAGESIVVPSASRPGA